MRYQILLVLLFSAINSHSQKLYFPPILGDTWATVDPNELGYCSEGIDSLYGFLGEKGTKGFIILKDGKIVLEKYFGTFTKDSSWYWASAGKTLTSFLTGMAQDKGLLDIRDKTSKYLGEGWTSMPLNQENNITIWHQLSMTTGLEDDVPEDNCMIPSCLQYKADPGTRWAYHNAPYRLIQDVIAKAWGSSYQNFINTQLTIKTGIGAIWYDGVAYSKPRSMARFGLLMLARGEWDGQKILADTNYIRAMVTPSQKLNKSYGLLWWLNGQESFMLPNSQIVFNNNLIPNAPADTWCGLGKNDQKIYIVPSQNIVIIRMGNDGGQVTGALSSFDNLLWDKINRLTCTSNLKDEMTDNITIYPNPASGTIFIKGINNNSDYTYELFQPDGKPIFNSSQKGNEIELPDYIPNGIYHLLIKDHSGQNVFHKTIAIVK